MMLIGLIVGFVIGAVLTPFAIALRFVLTTKE